MDFFKDSRFMSVDFDGCRFGISDDEARPLKKPWRLMTPSSDIIEAFKGTYYQYKPEEHGEGGGIGQILIPALPTVPVQHDSSHREKKQETPHILALSGLVELSSVVEIAEEARQLIENMDLNALINEISDLPKDPASPEVAIMGTNFLSRAEMLSSPEALAAVRAEANGFRSVPTWDEDNPRELEDIRRESRQPGMKIHIDKLITIAIVKSYELAKHLQKMKGRIICRGDCAKDEEGAAAVYRELGANSLSVWGLNACMAYGALPGNATTTADAIKTYIKAFLKSNF